MDKRILVLVICVAHVAVRTSASTCNTAVLFGTGAVVGQFLRRCPEDDIYKGECPPDWFKIKGDKSCYRFTAEPMSWYRARQECHHLGGSLVIIKDKHKAKAIVKYLEDEVPDGLNDRCVWTALNDINKEGVFTWDPILKGTKKFEDWAEDAPSDNNKFNCVGMCPDDDWKWVDGYCFEKANALCMRSPKEEFYCNAHKH